MKLRNLPKLTLMSTYLLSFLAFSQTPEQNPDIINDELISEFSLSDMVKIDFNYPYIKLSKIPDNKFNQMKIEKCSWDLNAKVKEEKCQLIFDEENSCFNFSSLKNNWMVKLSNKSIFKEIKDIVVFWPRAYITSPLENHVELFKIIQETISSNKNTSDVLVGINNENKNLMTITSVSDEGKIFSQIAYLYALPTNSKDGEYKFITRFKQIFTQAYAYDTTREIDIDQDNQKDDISQFILSSKCR